jgi:hypothetical protein
MKRKLTIELIDRLIRIYKTDPGKNDSEWDFFHEVLWGVGKDDPGVISELLTLARVVLVWREQATNALRRLLDTQQR